MQEIALQSVDTDAKMSYNRGMTANSNKASSESSKVFKAQE